ncbi:MAG: hypothetical protein JWR07_4181, partial [Nevskia sp.]|nr:hypothetical protein [Nevskia sp.]
GGENVTTQFSAVQGENLGIAVSNLQMQNDGCIVYYLYGPSGNALQQNQICGPTSFGVNLSNAPVTGTYRFVLVPRSWAVTFSAQVAVTQQ